MQDIGAINDSERLLHVVIGDQHAQPTGFEVIDQRPDFANSDGVNAGKRFIKQQILWVRREAARNLHAASFTTRQRQRRRAAQMLDGELRQQLFKPAIALSFVTFGDFEDGEDVVLNIHAPEDGHLLR